MLSWLKMTPEIAAWLEEARKTIHYNGATHAKWEVRFIEVYKELERANKIIDGLLK
jgi:hypothetical protein